MIWVLYFCYKNVRLNIGYIVVSEGILFFLIKFINQIKKVKKMGKLKECKGCGAEISKKAKSCPKCGEPIKKTHGLRGWY